MGTDYERVYEGMRFISLSILFRVLVAFIRCTNFRRQSVYLAGVKHVQVEL